MRMSKEEMRETKGGDIFPPSGQIGDYYKYCYDNGDNAWMLCNSQADCAAQGCPQCSCN